VTFCATNTLIKETPQSLSSRPLFCKRWSCNTCAPRRRWQLFRDAKSGNPKTFLTLTCNPGYGLSKDHRAQMLVNAWRKLRKRLIESGRYPNLPFIAVFEQTKLGEPHLHILLRTKYISHAEISNHMDFELGAPVVWINKIQNSKRMAAYVSKYASKAPKAFIGCKRYWSSRDFIEVKSKSKPLREKNARFFILREDEDALKRWAEIERVQYTTVKGWTHYSSPTNKGLRRWLQTHQ